MRNGRWLAPPSQCVSYDALAVRLRVEQVEKKGRDAAHQRRPDPLTTPGRSHRNPSVEGPGPEEARGPSQRRGDRCRVVESRERPLCWHTRNIDSASFLLSSSPSAHCTHAYNKKNQATTTTRAGGPFVPACQMAEAAAATTSNTGRTSDAGETDRQTGLSAHCTQSAMHARDVCQERKDCRDARGYLFVKKGGK